MVESATVGLLFHATLAEMIDHSNMKVLDRSSSTVIILTFVIVSLIGYTLTIPCLCYAAQRHSPSALIPYLVWRMLFSAIICLIVLWQALEKNKRAAFYRAAFYDKRFPVAVGEV
ncbi:unnamed protein product [Auanema sp. JU1783]|nr:unnamed protein product [Auanema sp. JU1783]